MRAASDDRTITSDSTSPDNTFDNALTASQSDSGVYTQLILSGGAAAAESPDNQGGYRVEYYNSGGTLVRRRSSAEINANPTGLIRWNGQGDSHVNDTLPYGAYTMRAYSSMRDPTIPVSIRGSGTTIDRPGDMHVSSGGILSWTNTGTRLSFCQVTLGDPVAAGPTFLRLVDIPTEIQGAVNTDRNYGITANSANDVFITADTAAGAAIAKYNTTTETWTNRYWATNVTTTPVNEDEWVGLGINATAGANFDSVYMAMTSGLVGGGIAGGTRGYVVRFRDNGTTATQTHISTAVNNADYYDVAVARTEVSVATYNSSTIESAPLTLTTVPAARIDFDPTTARGKSVWATSEGDFYFTDDATDSFSKFTRAGVLRYTHSDARLDGATGIAVYQKAATNETFVIVAAQTSNQIVIYKENAAGDSVTYVRTIEDDIYNLQTPVGLAASTAGNVFVVNRGSRSVKQFTEDGVSVNLTGAANGKYITGIDATADITDSNAFNTPGAIAVDGSGNIYVFDQTTGAAPTHSALKKFDSTGAPLGVIMDIDARWGAGVFNTGITEAVYAEGAIYVATAENAARVLRISDTGSLLGHLGATAAVLPADAAEGNTAQDVIGIQVAPYFNRITNVFLPAAVYVYLSTEIIEVWRSDFSGGLVATVTPTKTTNTTPTVVPQVFLVDNAGEVYLMDDGTFGGNYYFRKWNAGDAEVTFGTNELLAATFGQGSGASQLNAPRQAIWFDNSGVFANNPITGRYQQKIWVNDSANNRLQQFLVEWNDVEEIPITIALSQDTPLVISATLAGETTIAVAGTYYVGTSTCTVAISFNHAMQVGAPDTVTVQFKPAGGIFTTVNKVSYTGTTWTGTAAITAGMADGEAIVKVTDAYDATGTVKFIDPNPDQTDFDVADDFKPFVIDKTAPVFTVSTPPTSGDSTSAATYTISDGQVTSEATGLDATVQIINWTASSGGTQVDSVTSTADATTGAFNGVLDLQGPAPTNNWIEFVVTDKLGNRSTSARRLLERVKNVGSGYITPATETVVASPNRYQITYTAAQDLVGDSLKITIPAAWSAPQKTSATTNGYVTVVDTTGYVGDSVFSGQTITLLGVTRSIGQTLRIIYGDSSTSATGMAKSTLSAPLDNSSNTFGLGLMQAGETTFTAVSAESGKSLVVPLRDSSIAVAMRDTGPGAAAVEIGKSEETKVLTVRFFNSNLGAHPHRVTQLVLNAESDTGGGVNWQNTASQVVLKNTPEAATFATVTTMPAGSQLTIAPSSLITVDQGASRDVEVWVTISPSATTDTVRFYFSGTSAFTATDSESGNSITTVEQETGIVNRKTGLYDIVGFSPAETMSIGGDTSSTPVDVAAGQIDVAIMDITFKNEPPHADTPVNTARIDRVIFSVRNADGTSLIPGRVLRGITIKDASSGTTYGGVDTPLIPSLGDTISIDMTGMDVASNATVTAKVYVDIVTDTISTSQFRIRLSDTTTVTAKDKTTQATVRVRDDPARAELLPFQSDSVLIQKLAQATLGSITLQRADSTSILGEMGALLLTGEQFYAALNYRATSGRSSLRVIPTDTDLKLYIGGVDKTSEFTITAPSARTIAAGAQDTFTYSVIQNLGSTTGTLFLIAADTTADSRPRVFDNHDYAVPDQLRASLVVPTPTDTVLISASPMVETVFSVGTSYANAGETGVPILKFQIKNNSGSVANVDSVVVDGISAGSTIVTLVRLYHDNDNGILSFTTDTLVATGVLNAADTVLLTLAPEAAIGAGATETFFVAFDFATAQTDGDTFDAQIPALGLRVHSVTNFPSASVLNSSGNGIVEVVATRITMTPDTQIVAVGSSTNIALSAVDPYGNLDAIANVESTVQGNNIQVDVTVAEAAPDADTSHAIMSTSGLTGVTPTPGYGKFTINGNLGSGAGQVTIRDTEEAVVNITVASTLADSSGAIQYTQSITVSAVNLVTTDSGKPDSKAVAVLAFRVTNASGATDTLTQVGIMSLNTADTDVAAVILFKDANGNGAIDSGTDQTLATGTFSGGFVTFSGLSSVIVNGDSPLFLVGYNLNTAITDWDLIDARADTVNVTTGGSLVTVAPNSTPNRRVDITATHIHITPQTGTTGTNSSVVVSVSARDSVSNLDKDYTGGTTKMEFDLSLSPTFTASTLANQELPVLSDYSKIKGNLVLGVADLTFTDAVVETPVLSVTASVGITGTNETGAYKFEQGFTAAEIALSSSNVYPGDTNKVVLAFRVAATGTSDSVTNIKINWRGISTSDVTNIRLYKDGDANEVFSAAADALYSVAGSFTAETVTFTSDTVYVANGTTRAFFFVVDVAAGAVVGDTLDARLLQSSISTQGGITNVPSGIRNSVGNDTIVNAGTVVGSSYALTSDTFAPGDTNILIGSYVITNGKATRDTIATIVIKNSGTQVDAGITNIRLFIDANKNGTFQAATDTAFGTSGTFAAGSMSKSATHGIAAADTAGILVIADLSSTLAVDQKTLLAGIDTGGVTMASGDTAASVRLQSSGTLRVGILRVLISGGGGIADNFDTAVVSVSVLDSGGGPWANRAVQLTGDVGAPITVVSSNPQTTGATGFVQFVLKSTVGGDYSFSANVSYNAISETAIVTFTTANLSSGSNLGGNPSSNTQKEIISGAGNQFIGNLAVSGADTVLFIRGDGTNWQLYKNVSGVGSALLSTSLPAGSDTGQVSFMGSVRIANTRTSLNPGGGDVGLVNLITRSNGLRSQVYAVDLASGATTRITPKNKASVAGNYYLANAFRFFDMHPAGCTVVASVDGNLMVWSKADAAAVWDNTVDSASTKYMTQFSDIWGIGLGDAVTNNRVYAAYPTYSPDGTRIAFSVAYVSDSFASGATRVDRSEIYVIKNVDALTLTGFPAITVAPTISALTNATIVKVVTNDSFAYMPRWTRDGSGIIYSVAEGPNFDWQQLFQGYPQTSGVYDQSKFATRFVYYDKGGETAPYPPIDISTESFAPAGSLDVAMSTSGQQRLMYVRKTKVGATRTYELRSVDLASEATITTQGGVLFDSGRIVVIVPSSEAYGNGFKISSVTPDSSPSAESVIITGAAKNFYAPGNLTSPFYFADTITAFLYYGLEDFSDTEKIGFDSDGDGIPDRTEAAVSAYYYNGSQWIDYRAVRYPAENKIEFKTTHFSSYAVGLSSEARALAFAGSVNDIVAYPNPWRADGPTAAFAASDERYGIKLTNVPGPDVRVRIFTIAGEIVLDGTVNALNRTSTVPALRVTQTIINTTADGTVSWNLQNQAGRNIASGTYLMVLEGPGGRAVRKVAVIR